MTSSPDAAARDAAGPVRPLEAHGLGGAFALLAQMTGEFARSRDLDATLARALESIVTHVGAQVGSLWLLDEAELVCKASVDADPITGMRVPIGQGIVGRCVRENACQRVFDAREDPNFFQGVDRKTGLVTRSLLSAPMTFSGQPLGAIELVNKSSGDGCFSEEDAHLLQVLAASAALAIANARMAESLVEHERIRRELELAAEIQRGLLPRPRPAGFPIVGVNVPARVVSGDFFDILPHADGRIAFCLGDVSGKGVNAALLMAKTASLYRCLARGIDSPGQVLRLLNDEIAETATRGMFVTMVAGVFDPSKDVVRLANAGHPPALWHSLAGRFVAHESEAPPLGIAPSAVAEDAFPERRIALEGGALYVFSDGLTEARSETGAQLEVEGLEAVIADKARLPLQQRVASILEVVSGRELRDDVTLLGVHREADRS